MLIIRQEQMDEFIRIAAKSFEDWMLVHLKNFFPDEYQALGDPEIRETIKYGIGKAESYGITTERDILVGQNVRGDVGSGGSAGCSIGCSAGWGCG